MNVVSLLMLLAVLAGGCTAEDIGVTADEMTKASSAASTVAPRPVATESRASNPREEWRVYGADHANTKYSPLEQITPQNVATLQTAWRWHSADSDVLQRHRHIRTNYYETTPLMVGGVLFASTSLSQVSAIDPGLGATGWLYDLKTYEGRTPPNHGFVHRGVAYWSDGNSQHILFGTGDAHLIALDAATGQPIPTFGQGGRIGLWQGLRRRGPLRQVYGVTSPPIVGRDVVAVGASIVDFPWHEMPPGDIRGFDIRTSEQRWVFHAVPQAGEFGVDTWVRTPGPTTATPTCGPL